MLVLKFGGSSLESAEAVGRMCAIVAGRAERRPLVVVSAHGKTTDRLLALGNSAVEDRLEEALQRVADLREYHRELGRAVISVESREELDRFLDHRFQELTELLRGLSILGEITPRSIDALSSYGEQLSSFIITLALRNQGLDSAHVDSREVMVTDDRFTSANPLIGETNRRLEEQVKPLVEQGKTPVMGGFIASTLHGVTATLGRGGSDFTATLVGAGLGAEEIQIWTDVDGVMTADPSMMPASRRLRVMSFAEAAELAYFGARVLHPSTLVPAIEKDIPVRVLNSRKPEAEGTLIVSKTSPGECVVKSIAYKENITVLDIRSTRMLMAHGFLAKIFEIFDRYQTSVDMVTTSEVSVSLTIDHIDYLKDITRELEQFADVEATSGQVIVCLVGENLRFTPGIAGQIFKAVEGINVRMISQGASRLNMSFVVDEDDLQSAIEALHHTFFSEIDEEVFA